MTDVLSRWRERPFRILFSVPPRHAKTETLLHFFGWALRQDPRQTHAYISYGEKIALRKSRKALAYAINGGVQIRNGSNAGEWRTQDGGGVLATSIGGVLTGEGIDGVAVVDDPVKDRATAESSTYREKAKEWFTDTFLTRLEPGASCIVVMTRWHPDDLVGWLMKDFSDEWDVINLPALSEDGLETPLWPERWPKEALEEKRRNTTDYTWASLYQGRPRPKGAEVFGEPRVWTELPVVFRPGRGLDLAYTAKTKADWSVLVTCVVAPGHDKWGRPAACYYVVDVLRKQCQAPEFQEHMRRHIKGRWPRTPIWIYGANGPEAGAIDLMRGGEKGLRQLVRLPAVGDKFVRASPLAAAWNAGRVLVPEDSEAFPWVDEYVAEHVAFTGVGDAQDDQVDASAAMYDSVALAISDRDIEGPPRLRGLAGMPM